MEIIDREFTERPTRKILFISVTLYCILTGILVVLNAYTLYFFASHQVDKDSDMVSDIIAIAGIFGFAVPTAAFMLSLIFAWLPYKNKPFEEKILPISFLIYLVLNILLLPCIIVLIVLGFRYGTLAF